MTPRILYGAAQVRELDRRAIEDHGIDGYDLMQRAAAAAFRLLRLRWPRARRVAVFCGGGNNGGDGLVMARLAHAAGYEVRVALHGDPERLTGSAASAWRDWVAVAPGRASEPLAEVDPAACDVVVDALLGTGLDRPVKGAIAEAIGRINERAPAVLAIDIPSGLAADTGAVLGDAIRAAATATFIGAKRGLFTGAAPDYTGPVFLDTLGVPDGVYADAAGRLGPTVTTIDARRCGAVLPRRRPAAHKGDGGRVLVVGGDHGFAGAARLAGEAALATGAGLVTVATRAAHAPALAAARPELMARGVEDPAAELPALAEAADAVAVGPGLARGAWGQAALEAALGAGAARLVLDADALNLLAEAARGTPGAVLTPHPGEAARLLGTTTGDVQADRYDAAARLAQQRGATVILKGAGSLVARADGGLELLPGARPAMAVGGMGDVLTGVVAALLGQGLSPDEAAAVGAWLHAGAADRALARTRGTILPSDLFPALRERRREAGDG